MLNSTEESMFMAPSATQPLTHHSLSLLLTSLTAPPLPERDGGGLHVFNSNFPHLKPGTVEREKQREEEEQKTETGVWVADECVSDERVRWILWHQSD